MHKDVFRLFLNLQADTVNVLDAQQAMNAGQEWIIDLAAAGEQWLPMRQTINKRGSRANQKFAKVFCTFTFSE